MEVVGTPTAELLKKICSEHVSGGAGGRRSPRPMVTELNLCLQAQKYIQSLPSMPPQDMEKIFRGANPLGGWRLCSGPDEPRVLSVSLGFDLLSSVSPPAVDLLKRMLILDCDGRISASEALAHPYFSQYHDPDDEPEAPPYDQSLESKDRTLEEWKGKMADGAVVVVERHRQPQVFIKNEVGLFN